MGKIKEFTITTSLDESRGESQTYLAGSVVEGKVIIDLKQPKTINGRIKIVLSGKAQVRWEAHGGERLIHSDEQTIFNGMIVHLWGTGSETIIAAGKHEFPYRFQLPGSIPSSHEDTYGHIRYTLIAMMPTKKRVVMTPRIIHVHEIVDVSGLEFMSPLSNSNAKVLSCLCCTSVPIELSVTLDKRGYACGETIVIGENHGYRRISNVHATLIRKTTYHTRQSRESNFSYKSIATTRGFYNVSGTPGVKVGNINVPDVVPSIDCSVLQVTYFLSVTLSLPFRVANLFVLIPIIIGNVQRSTTNGRTITVPNASLQPMSATTIPNVNMPSTLLHPIPNTLPVAVSPLRLDLISNARESDSEVPDTPPPPYSECPPTVENIGFSFRDETPQHLEEFCGLIIRETAL